MNTKRAALVDASGAVQNVILVETDGSFVPPEGQTVHLLAESDSNVAPGWNLIDGTFEPPAPEPAGPVLPTVMDLQAQIDMLILEQLMAG